MRWRDGKCTVTPPSTPGTIWFLSRILAKVPRIITSWLPRRVPYWLKSAGFTLCSIRYLPAGESTLIEPAGEMWSVVIESSSRQSTRASTMSVSGAGWRPMPTKYGGFCT